LSANASRADRKIQNNRESFMAKPAFLTDRASITAIRALFVAAVLSAGSAWADDYADVSKLMRAGQYAEAMTKSDQYLATKPKDPQMRFLKGVIQTETGKTNDAIATFNQITQDYPELPEPYNNLAVLYAGQSQFDKARSALEMAIRTNPSYATAHENLGDVYAKLASQAYSKALQLDGGNAGVQPKLALIRTLFSADIKNPAKPTAAAPAPAPAAPAVTAKPAPTPPAVVAAAPPPAKPAPTPPPPVVAALPPAKPASTPAVAAPATPPAPAAAPSTASAGAEKEVESAVHAWADAWASKDMSVYLASYGPNFDTPGSQARKAWEDGRRARIVGKSRISVKLSNLSVAVMGSKATARFKQDYSADGLNVSSRKTLDLVKVSDRWVIVKESSGG
jgi:Flp pilus assembly protein TadD/ketosteroid isomerase-like protein